MIRNQSTAKRRRPPSVGFAATRRIAPASPPHGEQAHREPSGWLGDVGSERDREERAPDVKPERPEELAQTLEIENAQAQARRAVSGAKDEVGEQSARRGGDGVPRGARGRALGWCAACRMLGLVGLRQRVCGGEQEQRQTGGCFLARDGGEGAERDGCEERRARVQVGAAERLARLRPVAEECEDNRDREGRREHVDPAGDPGDGLGVDGVDGEEECRPQRWRRRVTECTDEREHERAVECVQQDRGQMKAEGVPPPETLVEPVGEVGKRAVDAQPGNARGLEERVERAAVKAKLLLEPDRIIPHEAVAERVRIGEKARCKRDRDCP